MSSNNSDEIRATELRARVTAIQAKTAKDIQEANDLALIAKKLADEIRSKRGTP